ncbi:putative 2-aminoethylphosphonate ABC transporter ATP-binding protein [Mesorhizobium sp. M4A.F.Ca.ET.020.02.1.1]|uniref:putative 2-aminoethylphosphonate ABC transporter ATP-binding protein n=1 Tax=unclassified Mesorhizobium TaxID=325217 RepID=UPI000FD606A6|nr:MULTISPECIES: putative 2-aminoethylphosphonate ABC transporter ATP-binding protein [unclassified Mesorhizobium]RVD35708.1 putative 2-aminoethylphosphonate ABC transporter ATP-binding protein [Mesorhizobium sp. M4A.F.Ca.ET.020.02.1.1]RWC12216.1 MAG: putative 2-aminoethylphosphonate ABC transporter ATP-binding protein [Mesorhizobium sp.]
MNVSNSQASALLEIRDVGKIFGRHVALKKIDLDVHDGEFVSFLGPSGCGKTTLLRIITGLERQSAGALRHAGRDISDLSAAERGFGILFQSYALFPNLTVRQNVGYGLKSGRRDAQERVTALLEMVGLPGIEDKYPSQLSGGQQQRVALARALAPRPKLLLLDEPLSAIDAKVRVHLREQIKDLQRRLGLTTIMVTHDQEEALAMADRIVVMNHGSIEQVGSPAEIYGHPSSLFVADFVGKMNVIAGHLSNGVFRTEHAAAAIAVPVGSADGAARLCVRPEDIAVSSALPDGASGANKALANVTGVEFLGPFTRLRLCVPDWGATTLCADVSARELQGLKIGLGESVTVALDPRRIQLLSA